MQIDSGQRQFLQHPFGVFLLFKWQMGIEKADKILL
jgi:hypothetical protein